jgi:hypothetical protein
MPEKRERRYFIVKHDLRSFQALPGVIWRSGMPLNKLPRGFGQIRRGDRWIEFAYITDEIDREPCSIITGFYESTGRARYGIIPDHRKRRLWNDGWLDKAWMIQGKPCGVQPQKELVTVPSIVLT